MENVIRYEQGYGSLPSVVTVKSGECRSFPQALQRHEKEICNRNMFGYDLFVNIVEAPREMAESRAFYESFADSMKARGITSPYLLPPDEMSAFAYHMGRFGTIYNDIMATQPVWDRTKGGQRPRTLFIKPR